jgi:hypothetical protein
MAEDHKIKSYNQYLFQTTGLPAAFLLCSVVALYFLTSYFDLSNTDKLFGYGAAFMLFLFWRFKLLVRWAKISNDKYLYFVPGSHAKPTDSNSGIIEPDFYEKQFSYAKDKKVTELAVGLLLIGLSYFFLSKRDVIVPLILSFGGFYFIRVSLKGLLGGPIIKFSKRGIWTKESNYLPWTKIAKIYIHRDLSDNKYTRYLHIFLQSDFSKDPNFSICIDDIEDSHEIEKAINKYRA